MHGRHPTAPVLDPGLEPGFPAGGGDEFAEPVRRAGRAPKQPNNRPIVALLLALGVVAALALVFGGGGNDADRVAVAQEPVATQPPATAPVADAPDPAAGESTLAAVAPGVEQEVAERPSVDLEGCMLDVLEIKLGDEGEAVECTQKALYAAGYYDGDFTGVFDGATDVAVRALQHDRELYVDGVVGARTATSLGIWPGDEAFIVRTPPPPPGAKDLWGMPLSPVASAGDDAPPMPENTGQGTGYRIVYSRAMQRVWAVNDAEQVVRSYLVSGSQYKNEVPGLHKVYSRSEVTTAWNGAADLPLMVRWLDTERGAIGFHAIPNHRDTGEPYQTTDELGQKLSGGCQRQHMLDAQFMWAFGKIGTPVYVV